MLKLFGFAGQFKKDGRLRIASEKKLQQEYEKSGRVYILENATDVVIIYLFFPSTLKLFMQPSYIDIQDKAKELGFDYSFLLIAIETFLMYKKSEDKRKETWDKVVWLQYFNMNVANFKRSKNELDKLDNKLRVVVEDSFQPFGSEPGG